jgi:Mg2+/Co2+ transporter CorC
MGLNLPEDEADTIGGFVFGRLGHQAQQGEKAVWEGVEFHVEATDGRRIQKVRIVRTTSPSADLLEPKHDAPRNGMSVATSERNRVGSRP